MQCSKLKHYFVCRLQVGRGRQWLKQLVELLDLGLIKQGCRSSDLVMCKAEVMRKALVMCQAEVMWKAVRAV